MPYNSVRISQSERTLYRLKHKPCNKYGLLTKRAVKMAGCRSSSFFCVFMGRAKIFYHSYLDGKSAVNFDFVMWYRTPKYDLSTSVFSIARKEVSYIQKSKVRALVFE